MSTGELDLSSPVSHVAAELEGAGSDGPAPTIEAMAAGYRHPVTHDLNRIRKSEGAADDAAAVTWLIQAAVSELGSQVKRDGDGYRLAKPFGELRWGGRPVLRPGRDEHARLGDPFNAMTGAIFATNIRIGRNGGRPPPEDAALRDSMRKNGWLPGHPAVKDEYGVTLSGHRRLQVAAELRAEGHEITDEIIVIPFGRGDGADIKRVNHAWDSNEGARPYTKTDRLAMSAYLRERGWTQADIAEALRVAQQTISRDLADRPSLITQVSNTGPTGQGDSKRQRAPGAGRPRKLTSDQRDYVVEQFQEFGGARTIPQLVEELGQRSNSPIRDAINHERGRRQALAAADPAAPASLPSMPDEVPVRDQPSWTLMVELFSRLDAEDKALFLKEIGAVIAG